MPAGWDNRVSEVHAIKGDWILYENGLGSAGMSWCVREGTRFQVPPNFDNKLSSLEPSDGSPLINLYNGRDDVMCAHSAQNAPAGWNGGLSEAESVLGDWILYEQPNFGGTQHAVKDGEKKNLSGWFGALTSIASWAPSQVQPARKPDQPNRGAFGGFGGFGGGTTIGGPQTFYGNRWEEQ